MVGRGLLLGLLGGLLWQTGGTAIAADEPAPRHASVLALNPVGYWPADEGGGDVLHDRTRNANHGSLHSVSWDADKHLLDFTGAYQWAEIPNHPEYQSPAFSMGGWVFTRKIVGGGQFPGQEGMILIGNAYHTSGYSLHSLHDEPVLLGKSLWGVRGGREDGVNLSLRKDELVDVISGGQPDALGTRADKAAIEIGSWQHVLYTYDSWAPLEGGKAWLDTQDGGRARGDAGVGRLYVNGELIKETPGVPFKPAAADKQFMVGSDAVWWLQSRQSGSLDGSVRDLVMFDRALDKEEVAKLVEGTRPVEQPVVFAGNALVLDGREISLAELPELSVEDQRRALEQIDAWTGDQLAEKSGELTPGLVGALKSWPLRRSAAALLMKINQETGVSPLAENVPLFVEVVQNEKLSKEERAETVLALAQMKNRATAATPALADLLEQIVEQDGERLPRVEDLLRNALMRALLDIAPQNERARQILGRALAKPVLAQFDLTREPYSKLLPLMEAGRYMDALELHRSTKKTDQDARFFSEGDPYRDVRPSVSNDRAYTTTTEHKGTIFKVGEGVAWKGLEKISPEDFEAVVARVSADTPEALTWRASDDPHLYRVPITKIDPDGKEQTVYLEGEDFVIGTDDGKYRGWSIAVDTDGYIHLTGGMHNSANAKAYMPGSWEKFGASYDYRNDDYPEIMYWVSRKPGDIESLEFVGQRGNPRRVPVPLGMNYMNFTQDRNGTLYLYGRIYVQGIQSWGLRRYDVKTRKWEAVGGFAPDVKNEFPEWADNLVEYAGDGMVLMTMRYRHDHPSNQVLAWALQPHFYNFIRSWGVRFDPTNRMHVKLELFGLDAQNQNRNRTLYAWSDDGGKTFHRADGAPLELPLTVNPGPGNADVANDSSGRYWDLWTSLLENAGYSDARR